MRTLANTTQTAATLARTHHADAVQGAVVSGVWYRGVVANSVVCVCPLPCGTFRIDGFPCMTGPGGEEDRLA